MASPNPDALVISAYFAELLDAVVAYLPAAAALVQGDGNGDVAETVMAMAPARRSRAIITGAMRASSSGSPARTWSGSG